MLSATGPGVLGSSYAVLSLRYLEDIDVRPTLDIAASKASTSLFVKPEVFFSQSCTVVIYAGADIGSAMNHLAVVYDILRAKRICTVSFNDPPANLQASVLPPANGNRKVQVTVNSATTNCLVF